MTVTDHHPAPDALSGIRLSEPGLAPNSESLYRLFAGPSGLSPSFAGTGTNLAVPSLILPSCCFAQLQGFTVVRSPLLLAQPVSLLSLAPSGSCTHTASVCCYQHLPLLPFRHLWPRLQRFLPQSACVFLLRVRPLPSWVFHCPHSYGDKSPTTEGVFALQGVLPVLSFSLLPVNPPLRFDGWQALLSELVGIFKLLAETST
jgi:hypothetical protein